MDTFAFWLPLLFLFVSALVGTILKRRSCDHCLKKFEGSKVILSDSLGVFHRGFLCVFAQGLEIVFSDSGNKENGKINSLIIHPKEVNEIPFLVRPAPDGDTITGLAWRQELNRILHPSLWDRICRLSLNFYNMLRDAFGQAAKTILGAVSKDTTVGQVKNADKQINKIGSELNTLVPNAWEPVLEKHRGRRIIVERKCKTGLIKESGILEDYSPQFLLVRNVFIDEKTFSQIENLGKKNSKNLFDVLYARHSAVIRNTLSD
jgi:hypothetical protein